MIIRYSMLDSFVRCPAAFYKQHILGEVDTKKSSALEFGTALHLGIKTILEGGDGGAIFSMYWDSLRDTDMIYYRYGWQELKDLAINKFLPNFERLHAKKFKNFTQEETLSMPFLGEHTFQGTPDLYGEYNNALVIADWKTSSAEYKRLKIDKNPQMYCYAELYRQKYGKLPDKIMYKVFIKSEGRIQTIDKQLTQSVHTAMMKNVENISRAMLHMVDTKAVYHNHESCFCKGE